MKHFIHRLSEPLLRELSEDFPAVTITGPRQSGKTTLCRMTFPDLPYVSLEEQDIREFAASDPRGFLAQFPRGAILDEIQRVPDLVSYIQVKVDTPGFAGNYVLTGSQNLSLRNTVNQSLAGRTALLTLLPFTFEEISNYRGNFNIDHLIYNGGYLGIFHKI